MCVNTITNTFLFTNKVSKSTTYIDLGIGISIQDPGSHPDPGSWIPDPGSRILDPGSWILEPGSWILLPGSRILELGTNTHLRDTKKTKKDKIGSWYMPYKIVSGKVCQKCRASFMILNYALFFLIQYKINTIGIPGP